MGQALSRSLLHDLFDLARQFIEAEGLGQEMDIGAAVETLAKGLLGIAGNTDDLDLRPVLLNPFNQGGTVHIGHDNIGDQQVDGVPGDVDKLGCGDAAARLQHLVALVAQRPRAEHTHRIFVFHQKHGAGAGKVTVPNSNTPTIAGQITLASFPNEVGLVALGQNLFKETPASGSPTTGNAGTTGFGTLLQGFLETSNVDVVTEITNLITAQRAYEMNSKVIETSDQMLQTANNVR